MNRNRPALLSDEQIAALSGEEVLAVRKEKTSQHYRDLYDALGGNFLAGEADYREALAFFYSRGMRRLGYSSKRGHWAFMALDRTDPKGEAIIVKWVLGPEFLAMIRDRRGTLQSFWDHNAKVLVME